MSLQEFASSHFPYLYQIYFEKKRNELIRKNKCQSPEEMREKLGKQYFEMTGKKMDAEHPSTYTELIQHRKLYDHRHEYTTLSDKIAVRKWIKDKGCEKYLIPLLGTWNCFDEIDFNRLPSSFVLKTNNASGTNIIVPDKKKLNKRLAKRKFDYWIKQPYWYVFGYEMQYLPIVPKILAEEMITDGTGELNDYKFLCFHGKVYYIWVDFGRGKDHTRIMLDRDFHPAPFHYNTRVPRWTGPVKRPENLDEMIELAEKLSEGFDHVRVDLYDADGKIYFGEMTFTSASGLASFEPPEWDEKLGRLWLEGIEP